MRAALVMLTVVVLGVASTSVANVSGLKVIVNPKNPIGHIDRDTLRNAYLKKTSSWSNGEIIRPIDLTSKFPEREQFTRRVLKKTPAQLKTYWNQQIFSGKGVPPPEATTAADVVRYVLANPGAVGYVPADVEVRGAKVVEVQ